MISNEKIFIYKVVDLFKYNNLELQSCRLFFIDACVTVPPQSGATPTSSLFERSSSGINVVGVCEPLRMTSLLLFLICNYTCSALVASSL